MWAWYHTVDTVTCGTVKLWSIRKSWWSDAKRLKPSSAQLQLPACLPRRHKRHDPKKYLRQQLTREPIAHPPPSPLQNRISHIVIFHADRTPFSSTFNWNIFLSVCMRVYVPYTLRLLLFLTWAQLIFDIPVQNSLWFFVFSFHI